MNILVISLCAVITGAKGWEDMEDFGRDNLDWLSEFLSLESGIPSADTFRRVFESLDPKRLEAALRAWVSALGHELGGQHLAIDGKAVKRAVDAANPTVPLHMLHVWAVGQGLLLAQRSVPGAPGEVRAAQDIIRELEIKGATITADANSCTIATTQAIREGGADYVLALKGNREHLHDHVKEAFAVAEQRMFRGLNVHTEESKGHGRTEERIVRVMELERADATKSYMDIKTAVMVDRTRTIGDKSTTERSYYISSRVPNAKDIGNLIRSHWSIENQLHWCLDVVFTEDDRRIRDMTAAENVATLSRIALMLLKRTSGRKADMSLVRKQRSAARRPDFLRQILAAGGTKN